MPADAPELIDIDAGAAAILARANRADTADAVRLQAAIDDIFLPEDARLDDEVRDLIGEQIARLVDVVEREIVSFAERASGQRLVPGVLPRLLASGLLRDAALMAEVIARVRQDLLADALRTTVAPMDRSDLVGRMIDCPDGVVAAGAQALLAAENRSAGAPAELSEPVHQRLVWWVAAALREHAARGAEIDRALADAAQRSLKAHGGKERMEDSAMRLAAAVDARPDELADLLIGALADGRPTLFFAVVAHAASLEWGDARTIVLDPQSDRLWLILRAQGLARAQIARIGLMLADADRRRDLDAFADLLDTIAALEQDRAAVALATMRLHPEFRAALRALARSRS